MSIYLGDLPAIAIGHNNQSAMMHLHWWNNKLFRRFYNYIETTYQPYETLVLSAARRNKPMGLPTATWKFDLLEVEQVEWVESTFFPQKERDIFVTIRTLDTEAHVWRNYNATFNHPRFHEFWRNAYYRDVVFEFFDLRPL